MIEVVEIAGLKNQLIFLDMCIIFVLVLLVISLFEEM